MKSGNIISAFAVILLGILIYIVRMPVQYRFTPQGMAEIAKIAIEQGNQSGGLNTTIESVVNQLKQRYPKHILQNAPWMFNNAGGAMGSMLVLHCSLTEYVIIFGTALGTEGHTGRFWLVDDYFTILHGQQWAYQAGSLEKEVYLPGDQHWLPRGMAKQYKMPDSAWALEYARGNIMSMMPFGFADGLTSTLDIVTLWKTVAVSARGVIAELFIR